jgi:pimeloyl-ACP methyl ester carboxylesterase
MWVVKLALFLAVGCAALIVLGYLVQTWMVFPTYLVRGASSELPAGAPWFTIPTADGERLAAVRLPMVDRGSARSPLIMGFGGNAWNAEAMALLLHGLIPDHDIVVAYYRGYRPSSGRPSAAKIMADALTRRVAEPPGVIAVGFSIGSGVAAHLAAERSLAGLVLVTPFDSLTRWRATIIRGHLSGYCFATRSRPPSFSVESRRPQRSSRPNATRSFLLHAHGRSSKQPGTWCTARSFPAWDTTISMTHPNSPL